jgi:hypothetical protein
MAVVPFTTDSVVIARRLFPARTGLYDMHTPPVVRSLTKRQYPKLGDSWPNASPGLELIRAIAGRVASWALRGARVTTCRSGICRSSPTQAHRCWYNQNQLCRD